MTDGDDRILAVTRWVALGIIPFLAVAAFLLFVFPDRTAELFAWGIAPPISAYLLASAYVGGIWFFARVAAARAWHRVRHGFPAVTVFATALLVATLLHLDRFSSNLSFAVWMVLYATTPFVIVGLWVAQRRSDSRRPDPVDVDIPRRLRLVLVGVGAAAFLAGAAVFVFPAAVIPFWPWELTPLTAQVTGAVLSLTGVVNAGMLRDPRWSAFRILFQAQLVALAAIVLSLVVRREDLLWDRPSTWAFVALIAVAAGGYLVLSLRCEKLMRDAARRAGGPRT